MSGGGGTPPAPTMGNSIGQANQTFGTATSNAGQAFNTAQSYNNNAQQNLAGVLGTSNNMSNMIGQNAQQNLNSYQQNFMPLQQSEAQQAQAYGSDANTQRLAGQAIANVNQAGQAAQQNNAAALAAEGVDPASLGGGAIQAQNQVANAANAANAGTQSAVQTQQQAFQMANQANQLGLNVGAQGTAGAATGAQVAQAGQGALNATNAGGVNNLATANSMLGQANQANQVGTTASNDQFQQQMAAYNAQQQQQAGVGQMIGNVAGMAAMAFMEEGGPVMFDRGIPVFAAGGPVRTGMPRYPAYRQPMHFPVPLQPARGIQAPPVNATNYAAGGQVMQQGALPQSPIPGSTDTKPALLTPGEFVIPKDVVDFKGQDFFHRQIDSVREARNKRMAIPIHHPPHVSMQ